ncbi:MAG: phosphonate ABC transporter, permease protein PhnE, partial [Deinococcales bacterium]
YGVWVAMLLAGVLHGAGAMLAWRPHLHEDGDVAGGILYAAVLLALAPAFASTEFSFAKLAEGWPFLLKFLDRAWPPLWADPSYGQFGIFPLQEVASQMLITLEIALVGTFLGAIFAVPLSFLAARNLTQGNPLMRVVFALTRGFFNLDRGVDTLILALIFVAAVGLGPFAGVLAMAIHSIADLGKLYSESIENVDRGPIEALEAVGASGSNVVRWSILPQVAPLFLGWTLYRFEINFRVSIVLGLVGAGGIGFFIQDKMSSGRYDQMIIAILAIVIVVNIIDFASSWLRSRLV